MVAKMIEDELREYAKGLEDLQDYFGVRDMYDEWDDLQVILMDIDNALREPRNRLKCRTHNVELTYRFRSERYGRFFGCPVDDCCVGDWNLKK